MNPENKWKLDIMVFVLVGLFILGLVIAGANDAQQADKRKGSACDCHKMCR